MIDQADYAVLNAVSENEWPAYLLNGAAGMENIMNRPTHGLGTKGLIEHFSRLWHTGLLECSFEESGTALFPDIDLARGQFERDSDDNPIGPIVWYRLSRVGGDLWEKLTSPDWSKFIRSRAGQASSTWIHASGDRARVELLRKCPIPPIPVPGTERWEVCEPWRATYWKLWSAAMSCASRTTQS